MGVWTHFVSQLLDVLSPPLCAACDRALSGSATFCEACRLPAFVGGRSELCRAPLVVAGACTPPLSTAIVRFKYGGRGELSRPLARLLLPALSELDLPRNVVFVPVPLHAKRLAERG